MPERTRTLPLIPLDDAVVLPNMALAVSISTDRGARRDRRRASGDAPAHVVLVTAPRRPLRPHRHRRRARRPPRHAARAASAASPSVRCTAPSSAAPTRPARRCASRSTEQPDPDDPSRALAGAGARVPRRSSRRSSRPAATPASPRSCAPSTRPGALADTAGYSPDLSVERKLELLETLDVEERLEKAIGWAKEALGDIELRRRIRDDVTDGMEKQQREFLLRRQMDAIRKELGDEDERRRRGLPHPHRRDRRCPTRRARRPSARSTGSQRPAATAPRRRRSAPTSTAARAAVGQALRRAARRQRGARRSLDADHAGLDEVKDAHPRVPRRAQVPPRARHRRTSAAARSSRWSARPASARRRSASRSPRRSAASSCA